jgi:hypothetical protein
MEIGIPYSTAEDRHDQRIEPIKEFPYALRPWKFCIGCTPSSHSGGFDERVVHRCLLMAQDQGR